MKKFSERACTSGFSRNGLSLADPCVHHERAFKAVMSGRSIHCDWRSTYGDSPGRAGTGAAASPLFHFQVEEQYVRLENFNNNVNETRIPSPNTERHARI
jgi:hypothetical protein